MNDADATALVNLIAPTTPVEAIGIYFQALTKIPANLKQFTYLIAVSLQGNAITSVDAADLSWSKLQEVNLQSNSITTLSGQFSLAYPFQANGGGYVRFDLRTNPNLTSLSSATFSMSADNIYFSFWSCGLTSVNGDAFSFSATQSIYVDFSYSYQITTVCGAFNLTATDAAKGKVELYFDNNKITSLSLAKFYLNGPKYVKLSLPFNSLTSVTADQITLKSTTYIGLDLQDNQLTSVKLAPDTNPPLTQGQDLYLNNNNLTGIIDCNDLGINSGSYFYSDMYSNEISGVTNCGAGSLLDNVKQVRMDWSLNSFTSLPAGSFNFAGNVYRFYLNDQKTAFTSIAPGALPGIHL